MQKSRRSAAQGCAAEMAQFMERYYTTNMTYVGAAPPACSADVTDFYNVGFVAAPTAAAYTIQAVPVAGGPQAGDQCGTMTINQVGAKAAAQPDCW
jgi:type IV pilus assembly protein PilE